MTYHNPRHSTTDKDPERGARQSSENARDAAEALGHKLSAHVVVVPRYTATGSTSARIRLEASDVRPLAVVLIQAASLAAPSAPLSGVVPTLNFFWDATARSLDVYEPAGLTQYTAYQLTFLVVEAQS